MNKQTTLTFIFLMIFPLGIWAQLNQSTENKIADLLEKMTLEEKIGQMNQLNGFWDFTGPAPTGGDASSKYELVKTGRVGSMLNVRGVKDVRALQKLAVEESRLGIPIIFAFDLIHGYKTVMPIPLAEAASWDMELIKKSARISAIEATAVGLHWTFAPMVDITRDARWGRVMEGAGEDPYLGSLVAAARVKGFQGDDLKSNNTLIACAKHFLAYGFTESGKEYNTVELSESTLENIALPPFKATVDAGIRSFMTSFNDLNGIPATADKYHLRTKLKEEWGFSGLVVSDWGSIGEMVAHGYSKDGKQAAFHSITAGTDMDMEASLYTKHLLNLVKEGRVPEALIDDAVKRILRIKFEIGLFDDPYAYLDENREKELLNHPDHHTFTAEIARKSIVLLKNDNQLLPLKGKEKIALIGPLANDKNSPLGSWRIAADDNSAVSVLEGLKNIGKAPFVYEKGAELTVGATSFYNSLTINNTDKTGFKEAIEAAKKADKVVLILGENGFQSGEGRSRTRIDLPGVQEELLREIHQVNSNIILVVMSGRPLDLSWADQNIPTIVQAWQLGSQSGTAIAETLYGLSIPSGKLPMSFPRNVGQLPLYYNVKNTGRPNGSPSSPFWSHYTDEKNSPLYPFGHGLSYTEFAYSDLKLSANKMTKGEKITVSITVENTGDYDGEEVVQLYLRDEFSSLIRPIKELKGYKKIFLKKGTSQTLSFEITEDLLAFYSANKKREAELGTFKVYVGGNAATTRSKNFELVTE